MTTTTAEKAPSRLAAKGRAAIVEQMKWLTGCAFDTADCNANLTYESKRVKANVTTLLRIADEGQIDSVDTVVLVRIAEGVLAVYRALEQYSSALAALENPKTENEEATDLVEVE